jgi:hypothetical protein
MSKLAKALEREMARHGSWPRRQEDGTYACKCGHAFEWFEPQETRLSVWRAHVAEALAVVAMKEPAVSRGPAADPDRREYLLASLEWGVNPLCR